MAQSDTTDMSIEGRVSTPPPAQGVLETREKAAPAPTHAATSTSTTEGVGDRHRDAQQKQSASGAARKDAFASSPQKPHMKNKNTPASSSSSKKQQNKPASISFHKTMLPLNKKVLFPTSRTASPTTAEKDEQMSSPSAAIPSGMKILKTHSRENGGAQSGRRGSFTGNSSRGRRRNSGSFHSSMTGAHDVEVTKIAFRKMYYLMEELFNAELKQYLKPDFTFFDIGCAPGGASQFLLDRAPMSRGYGFTLREEKGGFPLTLRAYGRYVIQYGDLLENPDEVGVAQCLDYVNLVFADAQLLLHPGATHQNGKSNVRGGGGGGNGGSSSYGSDALLLKAGDQEARICLLTSQVITGLYNLREHGTFVIRLYAYGSEMCRNESRLVFLLMQYFHSVKPWKSSTYHASDLSFYLVCAGFNRKRFAEDRMYNRMLTGYRRFYRLCTDSRLLRLRDEMLQRQRKRDEAVGLAAEVKDDGGAGTGASGEERNEKGNGKGSGNNKGACVVPSAKRGFKAYKHKWEHGESPDVKLCQSQLSPLPKLEARQKVLDELHMMLERENRTATVVDTQSQSSTLGVTGDEEAPERGSTKAAVDEQEVEDADLIMVVDEVEEDEDENDSTQAREGHVGDGKSKAKTSKGEDGEDGWIIVEKEEEMNELRVHVAGAVDIKKSSAAQEGPAGTGDGTGVEGVVKKMDVEQVEGQLQDVSDASTPAANKDHDSNGNPLVLRMRPRTFSSPDLLQECEFSLKEEKAEGLLVGKAGEQDLAKFEQDSEDGEQVPFTEDDEESTNGDEEERQEAERGTAPNDILDQLESDSEFEDEDLQGEDDNDTDKEQQEQLQAEVSKSIEHLADTIMGTTLSKEGGGDDTATAGTGHSALKQSETASTAFCNNSDCMNSVNSVNSSEAETFMDIAEVCRNLGITEDHFWQLANVDDPAAFITPLQVVLPLQEEPPRTLAQQGDEVEEAAAAEVVGVGGAPAAMDVENQSPDASMSTTCGTGGAHFLQSSTLTEPEMAVPIVDQLQGGFLAGGGATATAGDGGALLQELLHLDQSGALATIASSGSLVHMQSGSSFCLEQQHDMSQLAVPDQKIDWDTAWFANNASRAVPAPTGPMAGPGAPGAMDFTSPAQFVQSPPFARTLSNPVSRTSSVEAMSVEGGRPTPSPGWSNTTPIAPVEEHVNVYNQLPPGAGGRDPYHHLPELPPLQSSACNFMGNDVPAMLPSGVPLLGPVVQNKQEGATSAHDEVAPERSNSNSLTFAPTTGSGTDLILAPFVPGPAVELEIENKQQEQVEKLQKEKPAASSSSSRSSTSTFATTKGVAIGKRSVFRLDAGKDYKPEPEMKFVDLNRAEEEYYVNRLEHVIGWVLRFAQAHKPVGGAGQQEDR
eukprot:CAMPEP_0178986710 /NCGR_PEP_ID=MMETSP0795-20121207/2854_1 /TAXON_ID=88552 /ORGANISM="Amoebophrya sp., Strain Ameob2" /LENGTH=1377 /DNA_ID=CAMNT_0020677799 /DNA_START=240 /DNA_END=4373 /DNA_ORIENTATION=-